MFEMNATVARRWLVTALLVGAVLATSGCAYTMSDFQRQSASAGPLPASDASTTASLPVKPATYVVETPTATQPAPATTQASYPALNRVPEEPKSKLLTPEEKAKVIADLEALAKSQEASVERTRKDSAARCDAAVRNALDPEAALKSEAAGQGC